MAAALLTLGAGCDDDAPESGVTTAVEPQTTMHFNVDRALIGPMQQFEAFDVQLAPPAGWQALPQEQVAAVSAMASMGPTSRPADQFPTQPLAVFARADEGMWLIVSAVTADDPEAFESALRASREVAGADHFRVSGIDVHQYLIRTPQLVNFKLLLSSPARTDPRLLQLDYILPAEQYQSSARALESSLGSIRPLGRMGA